MANLTGQYPNFRVRVELEDGASYPPMNSEAGLFKSAIKRLANWVNREEEKTDNADWNAYREKGVRATRGLTSLSTCEIMKSDRTDALPTL